MQSVITEPLELDGSGIESREIIYKDHKVHYLSAGTGPPVICLHGGASDGTDWIPTMQALGDRFSFYAPDIIGFGRSNRNGTGYYLTDFIAFLEDFMTGLGIESGFLVGHSFGARVCLGVALDRPEMVKKMVLVDAAGLGKNSRFGLIMLNGFNLARRLLRKPQPQPTFLSYEGDDPDWACVADLPRVTAPTLLIWNEHDMYLPLDNARQALKLMPDARLEVMQGYGHAPHRTHDATFYRLLVEFFGDGNLGSGASRAGAAS